MGNIISFKNNLEYYLRLYDKRKIDLDLFGALDAARGALNISKNRLDKDSACMLLGQIYFEMELYSLSCEYYFRAVKIPLLRAGAYFGIARNLIMLNKFSLAVEYLDVVLEWDYQDTFTESVLYWNNILREKLDNYKNLDIHKTIKKNAQNLIKMKQFKELDDYLKQLIIIYNNDFDYKILLAKSKLCQNDFNYSRKILFEILKEQPHNIESLILMARLCIILEDYNSANEYLSIINSIENLSENDLLSIGVIYFEMNYYENVIKYFLKVLGNKPYKPKLLLFVAICYYNLGKMEDALFYVAKARWIDFDSAILKEFYTLFKMGEYKNKLELTNLLPEEIINEKIDIVSNGIKDLLFSKKFVNDIIFYEDIEWSISIIEGELLDGLSDNLTKMKNKKAINFVTRLLLSTRVNEDKKFAFANNAIRSGNYKYIDLTSNYRFRSFKTKINSKYFKNKLLRNSIANAMAYIECYANDINIDKNIKKISDTIINKKYNITEKELTCSFFYNSEVFDKVCQYFKVEKLNIKDFINNSYN